MNIVTLLSFEYLYTQLGRNNAERYLESLAVVKSAKVWIVCLDFRPGDELKQKYPHCEFVYSEIVNKHFKKSKKPCDGFAEWMYALDLPYDAVVLQCDADVIVQRDFTPDELKLIQRPHEICIGPNCGDNDTIALEGERIGIVAAGLSYIPCYNGGCIMATVTMFRRVLESFNAGWQSFSNTNKERSRSQFHFCMCLFNMPDKIVLQMPRTLHAHGHFGMPPGCERRGAEVFCGDKLVMFRHHL